MRTVLLAAVLLVPLLPAQRAPSPISDGPAANDLDARAAATFKHNFPDAVFFEQPIAHLRGSELRSATGLSQGQLDCLIGGPPCQAYSLVGRARRTKEKRREFEKDGRHFLFKEYLRIVREDPILAPRADGAAEGAPTRGRPRPSLRGIS